MAAGWSEGVRRLVACRSASRVLKSIVLVLIGFIAVNLVILSLASHEIVNPHDNRPNQLEGLITSNRVKSPQNHHHHSSLVYVYNGSLVSAEPHSDVHNRYPLSMHSITMRSDNPQIPQERGFEEFTKECTARRYGALRLLPKVSIIISFVENEELVDLLHTLHSIAQRTPPQLLQEVILIDDRSNKMDFHDTLQNYVESEFKMDFQIVRSVIRLGLIKARLVGANIAKGGVLVFMDAHMEVQQGWLQPLLWEIHINNRTLASSYLDWMDHKLDGSWVYRHGGSTWVTYFEWNFSFGFQDTSEATKQSRKADPTQPLISPVTVGGMLAISRSHFYDIGAFDDGMELWGGENLDLAVRVWLLGGRVINVPCSHVAHLERNGHRDYRREHGDVFIKNYKRFAEVWMGDFSKYFYLYQPQAIKMDVGNLTSRLALLPKAKHDFRWYLNTVFPELSIPDENIFAWGKVHHVSSGLCLGSQFPKILTLLDCETALPENLIFSWKTNGELRSPMHVFEVLSPEVDPTFVRSEYTLHHGLHTASKWLHWQNGQLMLYPHDLCIEQLNLSEEVRLVPCSHASTRQHWRFDDYTTEFSQWVKGGPPPGGVPVGNVMTLYHAWADSVFRAQTSHPISTIPSVKNSTRWKTTKTVKLKI